MPISCFCSAQSSARRKLLPPEIPFLLRGAVSRRVHVELFPYDFLIDHPHNRPIRRNGRLGTFLGQNPHQYPLESQHGRLLILPAALLPGIRLRRGTANRRGMPVHYHGGDGLAVLIRLRRFHDTQSERVFLTLPADGLS
jgi:hypothetical protein